MSRVARLKYLDQEDQGTDNKGTQSYIKLISYRGEGQLKLKPNTTLRHTSFPVAGKQTELSSDLCHSGLPHYHRTGVPCTTVEISMTTVNKRFVILFRYLSVQIESPHMTAVLPSYGKRT